MMTLLYILCAVSVVWLITAWCTQKYGKDILDDEMKRAREKHDHRVAELNEEIERLRGVLERVQHVKRT